LAYFFCRRAGRAGGMSRASCAATLGHLAEYRGIVDTLTKLLDDEAAADVPAVLERLAAVDTRLQQSASKLLDERAQRERTAALSELAGERRTELLQLASKLQRTEAHLSTLAAQARPAPGQA
jgi:DNA-binding FrmR family transcriptional regulator